MGIRDVLDSKMRKMDKSEKVEFLSDNATNIANFYIKKGHQDRDGVNALFDKMEDEKEKFAPTLLKMLKVAKEEDREVEVGLASVIGDFLERRRPKLEQETIDMYADAVNSILKKRTKKVCKKLGLDKGLVTELLIVVPDKEYISNPKFVGIYVNKILRKLYYMSRDNELGITSYKMMIKIFKELFNEDLLPAIAVSILLERKDVMRSFNEQQLTVWGLLTDTALNILNKLDKESLKTSLIDYIERRSWAAQKGNDGPRRIQLTQLTDDYSKIAKAVVKLADKEKNKKYL